MRPLCRLNEATAVRKTVTRFEIRYPYFKYDASQ